jgi:hypothetical protein
MIKKLSENANLASEIPVKQGLVVVLGQLLRPALEGEYQPCRDLE